MAASIFRRRPGSPARCTKRPGPRSLSAEWRTLARTKRWIGGALLPRRTTLMGEDEAYPVAIKQPQLRTEKESWAWPKSCRAVMRTRIVGEQSKCASSRASCLAWAAASATFSLTSQSPFLNLCSSRMSDWTLLNSSRQAKTQPIMKGSLGRSMTPSLPSTRDLLARTARSVYRKDFSNLFRRQGNQQRRWARWETAKWTYHNKGIN